MPTVPSINTTERPKVFFSVKVLDSINGKTLKSLRPDEDGYFTVPVAVLGENSRNGLITMYQVLLMKLLIPILYLTKH